MSFSIDILLDKNLLLTLRLNCSDFPRRNLALAVPCSPENDSRTSRRMNSAISFSNRFFVVVEIVVAGMSAEIEALGGFELQLPSRINPAISSCLTRGLF